MINCFFSDNGHSIESILTQETTRPKSNDSAFPSKKTTMQDLHKIISTGPFQKNETILNLEKGENSNIWLFVITWLVFACFQLLSFGFIFYLIRQHKKATKKWRKMPWGARSQIQIAGNNVSKI